MSRRIESYQPTGVVPMQRDCACPEVSTAYLQSITSESSVNDCACPEGSNVHLESQASSASTSDCACPKPESAHIKTNITNGSEEGVVAVSIAHLLSDS